MFHPRQNRDLSRLWDVLVDFGALAYFAGFFAAVELALQKLAY